MLQAKFWFTMSEILAVLAVTLMLPAGTGAASNFKVLHRFTERAGRDGLGSYNGVIFDAAGNLYGTTPYGGNLNACNGVGCGVVFKLKPNSDGTWTESVLYRFCSLANCADGSGPGTVILDAAGNIYGTTSFGRSSCGNDGCDLVFKLKPNSDGTWTESVLYRFCSLANCADGASPTDGLIFDALGNLYGTTYEGGDLACNGVGCGVVFKLKPNSDGSWTETVLYSFNDGADGGIPYAGVIFDALGNFYGTTSEGGNLSACNGVGCGVVFKLKPNSDGTWTESVLHSFTGGADGRFPGGGVILDATGNLFGTTNSGGRDGYGAVFKLKPQSDGSWKESVLHAFADNPAAYPIGGLTFDPGGSLYSATALSSIGAGVVYKVSPKSGGGWAYSVLHLFFGKPAAHPNGDLVLDKAGNVYGTTSQCGKGCQGVVFEITP